MEEQFKACLYETRFFDNQKAWAVGDGIVKELNVNNKAHKSYFITHKELLNKGQTGLSVAFDLPTQLGLDSDDEMSLGEVGKVGVAIDSLDDMRTLLADLPLDKVTTSMTINSTAAILLLMYELVAEERGVPSTAISGTIQNDLLKEALGIKL